MNPGRELDVLVAEKVMGLKAIVREKEEIYFGGLRDKIIEYLISEGESAFRYIPNYSTKIEDAWAIVYRLTEDAWRVKMIMSECGGADVILECNAGARGIISSDTMEGLVTTAPHAICLAALKVEGLT